MTSDLSKSEYLKRYLENDENKAKRKKKPKPRNPHVSRIKIVDTNIDIKSIKFGDAVDENLYEDEEPVVADVIDDRPVEEKLKEVYESSRWKKLDSASDKSNLQEIVKRPYLDSEPKKSPVKNHTQKRHDSDSDISPPRTLSSRARHDSDSDVSPPRRNQPTKVPPSQNSRKHSSKSERVDSDSDLSPERMISRQKRTGAKNSDSDLSPPRKSLKDGSPKRENKKRPRKTLSGLNAGLQDAASLRSETAELRVREKKLINELDGELSGRNAETVVRDKRTGKKRNLEEENNIDEEKQKKLSEVQRIYSKWGKGIEQAETQQLKVNEDMYELSKPLARYCDDEDLEARLKAVIHDDDPMAQYIKKKRQKDAIVMPEYTGPPPPPNRFGIKPGYRWDGVDRSNGFENKYFAKKSNAKALEDESYLWSVQDM